MAWPAPTIVYNASTGSDTQASGAPANMSPIFGSNAQTSNSSNIIDLSIDAPDLSGVPTDGTAAIFINNNKLNRLRMFFTIVGVDNVNKIITTRELANATGTFPWAIGGKRATLDWHYYELPSYGSGDWILELETDQTISSMKYGDRLCTIRSSSSVDLRNISWNYNGAFIQLNSGSIMIFKNLKFINTATVKNASRAILNASGIVEVYNCVFGDKYDSSLRVEYGIDYSHAQLVIEDCAFFYCLNGIYAYSIGGRMRPRVKNCLFAYCTGAAIRFQSTTPYVDEPIIEGNIFYQCLHGVYDKIDSSYTDEVYGRWGYFINNNVFANNSASGIRFDSVTNYKRFWTHNIHSNIFYQNGAYGIEFDGFVMPPQYQIRSDHNCYWQNTSGATKNYPAGPNDVYVDPQFADPANLDFRIGPNLKAKGWPKFDRPMGAAQTNTYTFVDIGAAQRKEPTPVSARRIFIPSMT